MINTDLIFGMKKADIKKLLSYGFTETGDCLQYKCSIENGDFSLNVTVHPNQSVEYAVYDLNTEEEYTLIKIPGAQGSFLGKIREICEEKLKDIANQCFDADIYRSEQTERVINYIKNKYGALPEYLWSDSPDSAVFRHTENGKWFAVIMKIDKSKLSPDMNGPAEIMDLKAAPEVIDHLVKERGLYRGYHMNKKHWYTVILDGSLDDEFIFKNVSESFDITK